MNPTLRERLRAVRLVSLDVDGVLTDGGLYYTDEGTELRKFHVRDGMGIKLLQKAGIAVAIISQSVSPSIQHRGRRLGVDHCLVGVEDKLSALQRICAGMGVGLDAVCHIADDVNDLPPLRAVGVPMTVPGGVKAVRDVAVYRTEAPGGNGAVREAAELILEAQGVP